MSDEKISRNLRLPAAEISPAGHHAYYQKSWALVIGINDYEGRRLVNARNDAEKFAALLKEKYSFEEVISLLDKDASRENILRYLREDLKVRVGAEDRLIIFFAGHGESEPSKGGGKIGYIIPQDARKNTSIDHIDMDELRKACDRISAKHILIILDCCFSGVAAITTCRRGKTDEKPPKKLNDAYLRKLTEKKAYQIMTAGDVDQSTPDSSLTPGHSAFTAALLNGLRGDADSDGNGLITATELYDYIQPRVLSETSKDGAEGQMPFLDYIKGSDIYHPGNFVFMLPNAKFDHIDEKKGNNGEKIGFDPRKNSSHKDIIEKLPIIASLLMLSLIIINFIHPIFPDGNMVLIKNDFSGYEWNFSKDLDGWESFGWTPSWGRLNTQTKWQQEWPENSGCFGVIVLDACGDRTPEHFGGIQKTIKLPAGAARLLIDAVKHENNGGIRIILLDINGENLLDEKILSGTERKLLQYNISRWAGHTVTLQIRSFGYGEGGPDENICEPGNMDSFCCGEHIGLNSIQIIP
jgi:hypothetical protein